jgi:hypothetical protein
MGRQKLKKKQVGHKSNKYMMMEQRKIENEHAVNKWPFLNDGRILTQNIFSLEHFHD